MKAILISIKPRFVAKILNGEKTVEIRKTKPNVDLPIDVYIYCTKDKGTLIHKNAHYKEIVAGYECEITRDIKLNGKVVAKFTLNKVEEIKPNIDLSIMDSHSKELIRCADLSLFEGCEYLKWNIGYAWHISNLVIFDKPKELNEFRKVMSEYNHRLLCADCPRYWEDESGTPIEPRCELNGKDCDKDRLTKAPQSECVDKLGQLEDILEGHNIETLEELDGLLWYVKQIKDIEQKLGIDLIEILGNGDFQHLVYCFTHNVPFIFAPKEKELKNEKNE